MINQLTIWLDPELTVHLLLLVCSLQQTVKLLEYYYHGVLRNIAHYNLNRQLKISYIVSITWTKGQTHIRSLAENAFPSEKLSGCTQQARAY